MMLWDIDSQVGPGSKHLLEHINNVLKVPLTHEDIQGVFAGLRPLLSGESELPSELSREHAVARPQPGLVSIAGGKYTTYRIMAQDAVDTARADIGGDVSDSVTEFIPLSGAEGYVALVNQVDRLARKQDLPVWRIRHLLERYGSLVHELFALAENDRTLYEPLPGAEEYLKVEIRYAATHEAALHLDDFLTRRTRVSIETRHRGTESARAAADIVAPVFGWDEARVEAEVAAYLARVDAELESQQEIVDTEANAERLSAPDPRRIPVSRD